MAETHAQKDQRIADMQRQLQEREQFKTQVREVAIRVADEMGWCNDGLNEVLEELGLDKKTERYRMEITVTFDVEATCTVSETVNAEFIKNSVLDSDAGTVLKLDDDWKDVVSNVSTVDVREYEREN